jgi:flagellar hook-associated protein 3 FlgL
VRISTKAFQLQWLNTFRQQQAELATTQRQVGNGRRLTTAADDPAGAAQALLLQQGLERIGNYAANAETARRRLSLSENALSGVNDVLDRVRELAIQSGGTGQSREARDAIASEARELLENLVALANSQDGEGRSLFAGNNVLEPAFVRQSGSVAYNGDDGTRTQRIGDHRTVQESESGARVFGAIRAGNGSFTVAADGGNQGSAFFTSAAASAGGWSPDGFTLTFTAPDSWEATDSGGSVIASGSYAPGETISFAGASLRLDGDPATGDSFTISPSPNRDVFVIVQDFIDAMSGALAGSTERARFQNRLNSSLMDIDRALSHLGGIRSEVGGRLAVIDEQLDANAELGLQLSQTLSTIRDLDYAQAVSDLERQLFGLEAAQKTFARTRSFSLFDVL